MNRLSIRARITLWFAAALIAVVSLTYVCILTVSNKVLQKTIKDNLIETVENNVDEIEYYNSMDEIAATNDVDHFIRYGEGFLEVDDDFLESVNEVYTALYDSKLFMLYGENPVAKQSSEVALKNMTLHTVKAKGIRYYIYDRELSAAGLQGLWLRGVVAETQGKEELTNITRLSLTVLPLIGLLAILGGSVIAKRALSPIQKISDTVSAITQGNDLKKRIELKPGKDELHQLADSFNLMFARLEDSFEKEKRFTSDVSHELRTPMAVIMAQCEYSLENDVDAGEYAGSIRNIHAQGRKMTSLINQMLDLARLEMRPENYPKESLDLSALLRSVCEDLALIREKGIVLSSEIADGITMRANRNLLERAVSNLILNAYRYGNENGRIWVSLYETGEQIVLEVKDDGIGIAAEDIARVFDRFYRAERSRTKNGTGLGLAITKEIAEFHQGSISLKSRLGEGSTFSLVFSKI